MKTADMYERILLALCVWREARGSSRNAKVGVKHVILNRKDRPVGPFVHCKDIVSNILAPFQFSSFNRNDANSSLLPNPARVGDWKAWLECCDVVDQSEPDPTGGANYYFDLSISPPDWADPSKQTTQIDSFKFFRL